MSNGPGARYIDFGNLTQVVNDLWDLSNLSSAFGKSQSHRPSWVCSCLSNWKLSLSIVECWNLASSSPPRALMNRLEFCPGSVSSGNKARRAASKSTCAHFQIIFQLCPYYGKIRLILCSKREHIQELCWESTVPQVAIRVDHLIRVSMKELHTGELKAGVSAYVSGRPL